MGKSCARRTQRGGVPVGRRRAEPVAGELRFNLSHHTAGTQFPAERLRLVRHGGDGVGVVHG